MTSSMANRKRFSEARSTHRFLFPLRTAQPKRMSGGSPQVLSGRSSPIRASSFTCRMRIRATSNAVSGGDEMTGRDEARACPSSSLRFSGRVECHAKVAAGDQKEKTGLPPKAGFSCLELAWSEGLVQRWVATPLALCSLVTGGRRAFTRLPG